jgi:hypothetical protein
MILTLGVAAPVRVQFETSNRGGLQMSPAMHADL